MYNIEYICKNKITESNLLSQRHSFSIQSTRSQGFVWQSNQLGIETPHATVPSARQKWGNLGQSGAVSNLTRLSFGFLIGIGFFLFVFAALRSCRELS
jgi:hypothetical protein